MAWVSDHVAVHGEVFGWKTLQRGFDHYGMRIPLVSMQGIFKPKACDLPLTIRTTHDSPYDDVVVEDRLAYAYRGTDPSHRDNVGLRQAMRSNTPLIYLAAIEKGRYFVVSPVFIVGDEPESLRFWVQVESGTLSLGGAQATAAVGAEEVHGTMKSYATRLVLQRLHQQGFRERVLAAYRDKCSMCRLRHRELLDAAHIVPDSKGGEPVVANGLSLCKIHHAAFDVGVLGVQPDDLRIHIRPDILEEVDGPMLRHGLQELHGSRLQVPRSKAKQPDSELLRWRWDQFHEAAG